MAITSHIGGGSSPTSVLSANGQYWVVNTSPPGNGPGGAASTQYTIVEGTQSQAENVPNAGGISGPYKTLAEAYSVWKNEPQNKSTSTLQEIEYDLGFAAADAANPTSPSSAVSAGKAVQDANPLSGLAAIGDFFSRLSEANTWIRVGKVLAGGVLLIIGIAHMTGMSNKVGTIARSVPIPV